MYKEICKKDTVVTIDKIRYIGAQYLGMTSLSGFKYLCEMVEIVLNSDKKINIIALYEKVAKSNNTMVTRVERAVRHYKEKILMQGMVTLVFKTYVHDKYPNQELIQNFTDFVKREGINNE